MRSGWTRRIRAAAAVLALVGGLWAQGAGAAEVKNVTAEYSWPWGAEIRYEVVGALDEHAPLGVSATDLDNNVTYTAEASMLSGDMGSGEGEHHVRWDLDKQGVKIQSTNVVFTVTYHTNGLYQTSGPYLVVDLSGGTNALAYPVAYMSAPPPGGFNRDEYKTTKLVLRRIEPGTFMMNGYVQTTLSKPYYIGFFEVTQKQYELVMGSNPSRYSGKKRPVEGVSWNTIRGNSGWPSSSVVSENSFMGRLRARTGLEFDLPTEAQWEYACRAGTTRAYSYGESANGDYMWYYSNSSDQTHDVGTKEPNPWGLYDMHGNVWEWCLDWYGSLSGGTDPKGSSSGAYRVSRGGSWNQSASYCTSSFRNSCGYPSSAGYDCGFRLARTLSGE